MARMLRIHALLERERFPNCQNLAAELEVSPKTIQRDIDFMRYQLELPIEYDSVQHGFFYSEKVHKFPTLTISQGELTALLVAQKAIEQYKGTAFQKPLESAFAKMVAGLPKETQVSIRSLSEAYSFRPSAPATTDLQTFETLSDAMMDSREVEFIYKPLSGSMPGLRRVQPYHLRCVDNQWYLLGFDHRRNAMRTFALTRMSKVVNTGRPFTRAVGFSVDRMMDGAFGAFEPRQIQTARLRLDEIGARMVAERVIHPSQKLKKLPTGGAELTLKVGIAPDLIRWILGLGAHAEVLGPPELRAQVRKTAATIAGLNAG